MTLQDDIIIQSMFFLSYLLKDPVNLSCVFLELALAPIKSPVGLKCCCGKSRKGDKAYTAQACTETEPGQSKCSCFKLGQACNRMCRCRDCCNPLNEKERKFRPARKNRKACMCGNGRKVFEILTCTIDICTSGGSCSKAG